MDEHLEESTALLPAVETRPRQTPLWHVVLLDDDDHTYDYVIEPNPCGETIWIEPRFCDIYIDQIVVDTL